MELIVGHTNTDFDAFGSMLAARRLYPGAAIALSGSLNRNVREFYRLHADEIDVIERHAIDPPAVTRLVAVEVTDPGRLGELAQVVSRPGVDLVLFDHHGPAPDWIAAGNAVIGVDGALSTTLVSILAERSIAPTRLEATALALGIHEDTGSLTYSTTTERDVEALGWCLRHGANQEMIARYLHAPLAEDERALFDAMLAGLETFSVNGAEVILTATAWPTYVDGVSNLAHKLLDVTDCPALVCLVEMDGRVVGVVRSRTRHFDAGALALALGGGGHRQAASAILHGSLAEARAQVLEALPGALQAPATAGEVMSRPVRFVSPDDTVAHAMALCQRHAQSGIQVGDPTELLGVVTREDLDKAIAHELAHAPVRAVMGGPIATCAEDTPLTELQRLLATTSAGRIPVVRDGEVVGVVTRGDLLRGLGETGGEDRGEPAGVSLASELLALPGLGVAFEAIQAVSGPFEGVYLVGGTVRDILIAEKSFDVDIAVEGDGIAFARALARVLAGRATPHEKFGTAVVRYGGDARIDVVSTRTELYGEPAALPTVEHAAIHHDLFRRDFTINAMAVSLRGEDFGRLVDPYGGLHDLRAGTLRVLHNLSFIDDPTRIFRGVRYEGRYRFWMDAHTVSLARACIEMGLVGELSSARLRDEILLLLEEHSVHASVVRLGELGLAAAIHPHLSADEATAELLEQADALRDRLVPTEPRWRIRLAILARRLPPHELYDWFRRLRLRRRDAEHLAEAVTVAPKLAGVLSGVIEPAEARRRIAPHDPLGALLALVLDPESPGSRWIERYFAELRDVTLEIDGGDLAGIGLRESPRVGEVLEELRRRKLNGELGRGRAAELDAARALLASGAASEPAAKMS
jgi:tRNA nucleotidyltransferase (CCA-adding enzyme)